MLSHKGKGPCGKTLQRNAGMCSINVLSLDECNDTVNIIGRPPQAATFVAQTVSSSAVPAHQRATLTSGQPVLPEPMDTDPVHVSFEEVLTPSKVGRDAEWAYEQYVYPCMHVLYDLADARYTRSDDGAYSSPSPTASTSTPADSTWPGCLGISLVWPTGDFWRDYPFQLHGYGLSDLGYRFCAVERDGNHFRVRADD